jgi:hypothetical protein
VGTGIFRGQAADFDGFSLAERRHGLGRDASRRERKLDFILQVVVPAQNLSSGPYASTMISLWMRSSRMRFLRSLGTWCSIDLLDGRSVGGFQAFFHPCRVAASDIRVGVLAQDSFNALEEFVQPVTEYLVLGVIRFGGHGTSEFVQIIQGEVKEGTLARLRNNLQPVGH